MWCMADMTVKSDADVFEWRKGNYPHAWFLHKPHNWRWLSKKKNSCYHGSICLCALYDGFIYLWVSGSAMVIRCCDQSSLLFKNQINHSDISCLRLSGQEKDPMRFLVRSLLCKWSMLLEHTFCRTGVLSPYWISYDYMGVTPPAHCSFNICVGLYISEWSLHHFWGIPQNF